MKRLLSIFMALATLIPAFGQNAGAKAMLEKMLESRTEFSYSYTVNSKTPLKGDGQILIQGDRFKMSGNGLEIFCDGITRWTLDSEAKEVYIENASDISDILNNPARLLEALTVTRITSDSIKGTFKTDDGSAVSFAANNIRYHEPSEDMSAFTLDTKSLGKKFVITDLR